MKKIISLILALVLVMGLAVTASAADDTGFSISITAPANVDTVTYKVYKVFDAVSGNGGISYTLMDGKANAPAGFTVDEAGNVKYNGSGTDNQLTDADISAIKEYVKGDTAVASVTLGASASESVAVPSAGYYYISTASGSVVAINSAKPTADVTDKNVVPTLEKKILVNGTEATATTASIGDTITFQITVTIPDNASGLLTVHDNMSSDLTINYTNATYTHFEQFNNPGDSHTADWVLRESEEHAGETLTITYTATVDTDATPDVAMTNTAWLTYGRHKSEDSIVTVTTYQLDVVKVDGNDAPLGGAKFKLKDKDKDTDKYYTVDSYGNVSWTEAGTEVEAILVGGKYVANFKGLGNGTYTLEESTVPPGYNKAADQDITITDASRTGDNAIPVVNLSGSELPSTGGMGTTLFYVIGGLMMACAAVILITKRRVA